MIKINTTNVNNNISKKSPSFKADNASVNTNTNQSQEQKQTLYSFKNQNIYQYKNALNPNTKNYLSIYYYNDTHGNSDQMAHILSSAKTYKNNIKNQPITSFVLSAGDNCSGGDYKKNEFIFDLMQNIIGVDASAVGNHETDAASEGFYEAAKNKNFSFIATNVDFDDDNPMKDIVKKSIIKEQNGIKYGFIGTMPIDFKMCTKKEVQKGINVKDFENTKKALQNEINNLKKQGINRIIMLSHVGYETDKKLASELDGVDIIIGGHTHSVVEGVQNDENLVKSKSGEPVIITQAGENGKYYGILNVEFDNNGILKTLNNNLIQTTNHFKSPIIEYVKQKNLGESPIVAKLKEIEPLPLSRRIEPCAWTCLMADAMKEELNGDIAIINSANIRKVPQVGNITERDITESAPMKNNLIKTKLTQKQLVEAVKNAAKSSMQASDGYPGLLQGSGFGYKVEDTGELLEMYLIDKEGNKTPIDIKNPSDDITYTAIYDTFTSKADGETPELAPKFEVETFDFDKDKTMSDYLSKLPNKDNLTVKYDKRIEIIKTSKEKQQNNNTRNV